MLGKEENEDELFEPYLEFANDIEGKPLKYKILIRDMCVTKILYNTG
jgi:hypothetical protein